MKNGVFSFLIILLFITNVKGQSYHLYYLKIDSAEYYLSRGELKKADSLYSETFNMFTGFPDDYLSYIINDYQITKLLNDSLIAKGFNSGLLYRNFVEELNIKSISFSKKKIKKIYKKNKFKRTTSINPIPRMLLRDQLTRYRKNGTKKADSINCRILSKLIVEKPDIFNRKKTGYFWSSMLNIIILHSSWKEISPIFPDLLNFVDSGYLNREALYLIVERNSIFSNYTFQLKSNKLVGIPNSNQEICPEYYFFSTLGQYYLNSTQFISYYVPTNPIVNEEEINMMRNFLFLQNIGLYRQSHKRRESISIEKFCAGRTKPKN